MAHMSLLYGTICFSHDSWLENRSKGSRWFGIDSISNPSRYPFPLRRRVVEYLHDKINTNEWIDQTFMNFQIENATPFLNRLEKELNPPQFQAVTYTDGPLLVLAGAGSGKTRVITYRIAYLIAVKRLAPWNILAVTFTNKAAGEMKERVDVILRHSLRGLWLGTFHSLCARILRYDGKAIGIDPRFSIYDTTDQGAAIKRAMAVCNVSPKEAKPAAILAMISKAKNRLEWPEQFEENARDEYEVRAARVYKTYQAILRENNALDFDDLLIEAVRLLLHKPEVGETYQKRFQHILVDEYQDTNHPQYLFLRELAKHHNRICAVGDDDQSIYRWRGADIRNILEFERDFSNVKIIRLEQNYRSTRNILAAAGHLVQQNSGRHKKTLWTDKEDGEKLGIVRLPDEISEAIWILNEVSRLYTEKSTPYGRMAVFYRTNVQSRLFEEECIKRGVPYRLIGNIAFYERKEIKDVLAYCRLLINPADMVSFQRIVNLPKRKLGAKAVQCLMDYASLMKLPILKAAKTIREEKHEATIHPTTRERFYLFSTLFQKWHSQTKTLSLPTLIETIVNDCGYSAMLEEDNDPQSQARLDNIHEFITAAMQFEKRFDAEIPSPVDTIVKLAAFLENVALVSQIDQLQEGEDALILMTLHGAKGLEFPYVFIAGMEEGLFPHSKSLDSKEAIEEERRLCYVGITRGQMRVVLTHVESRRLYGRSEWTRPSRFLQEIPDRFVEELCWSDAKPSLYHPPGVMEAFVSFGGDSGDWRKEQFEPGDMVNHRSFGFGVVLGVEGEGGRARVTVDFQEIGKKTVIQEFAKLTKV
ncbi:MAG: ATP-dependent DNA helicase PcrA [Candidatus Omnitrophota bacterium]|nr:MAG: ATP-dependent DNA helicase PcrA [Candidatus Omnitrophota bacterium]